MSGRNTKLTPERQATIVDAIRAGNFLETAARYAGINPSTLHLWLATGRDAAERDDDELLTNPMTDYEAACVEFVEATDAARAAAEVRNVALIQRAAQDTWQAAAWYLERSAPTRYGKQISYKGEVSGPGGKPIEITTSGAREIILDFLTPQDEDPDSELEGLTDGPVAG